MSVKQFNKSMVMGSVLLAMAAITGCQSNVFKREPVPEPRYIPTIILGEAQSLTILPGRVSCESALPMQCMLAKSTATGEVFQIPYDWIEGFAGKPDIEYQITARPQIDQGKQSLTGYWTLQNITAQRIVGSR